jgi:hypothetical protein
MISIKRLRRMVADGATPTMIVDAIEEEQRRKPPKRKQQVPADWMPPITDTTYCLMWSPAKIQLEIARFRDYHRARGNVFSDINAAWRNWCTSPYQKHWSERNGTRTVVDASRDLVNAVRAGNGNGQQDTDCGRWSEPTLPFLP